MEIETRFNPDDHLDHRLKILVTSTMVHKGRVNADGSMLSIGEAIDVGVNEISIYCVTDETPFKSRDWDERDWDVEAE